MKRSRAIIGRWVGLICYGALASIAWGVFGGSIRPLCIAISDYLASLPTDVLTSSVVIAMVATCWAFGRGRWLAFFGFRHFLTYPPLWIAVVTALGCIVVNEGVKVGWESAFEGLRTTAWLIAEVPFWLWIVIGPLAGLIHITDWVAKQPAEEVRDDSPDLPALIAWLQDDHEITSPHDDRFGHDAVARRIVERLTKSA